VANGFQGAFVNIQGKRKKEIPVGPQGGQGLDQAPEQVQVHLAHPDAAQANGFAHIIEKI
jgi:hypothetical protein